MKRLFCVVDRHNNERMLKSKGEPQFFNKKDLARQLRNEKNKEQGGKSGTRFEIRRGPDHRLGES